MKHLFWPTMGILSSGVVLVGFAVGSSPGQDLRNLGCCGVTFMSWWMAKGCRS